MEESLSYWFGEICLKGIIILVILGLFIGGMRLVFRTSNAIGTMHLARTGRAYNDYQREQIKYDRVFRMWYNGQISNEEKEHRLAVILPKLNKAKNNWIREGNKL